MSLSVPAMRRKPQYRRHTVRDLAFVVIDGKRTYLPGPYKSPESLAAYRAALRAMGWLDYDSPEAATQAAMLPLLLDRFLAWAEATYPAGSRSEVSNVAATIRLVHLHFTTPLRTAAPAPSELWPRALGHACPRAATGPCSQADLP